MRHASRATTVATLGTTQTLAWASSYYLPALLAVPIARDLHVTISVVFGAFSLALVVSAFVAPFAGRAIDRYGGRPVLAATNVVFAAGLGVLAHAGDLIGLFAAWVLLGIAMGAGLYEAAFAALVRLYGQTSRPAITGITLIAGFASTVGWPVSAWLETQFGWRGACVAWALLHLALALPLNLLLPRVPAGGASPATAEERPEPGGTTPAQRRYVSVLLALIFAVMSFVSTAMAAHLPHLLQASGATLGAAVAAAALVGPAQVAARVLEFGLLRRVHPFVSAQLGAIAHPIGAAVFMIGGVPFASVFAVLHGAGNGLLTIARGTLPLVLFGARGYGARQGLLNAPARVAQACAPLVFGLCIERWGVGALWISGALGLAAFAALVWLAGRQSYRLRPAA